jgi:aldehyde dehydrogenase family 7 member A1
MDGMADLSEILFYSLHLIRNLALSLAAGNATIWKPSPTTPLCAIAVTKLVSSVLERNGIPGAVANLVTGGKDMGEALVGCNEVELGNLSYT